MQAVTLAIIILFYLHRKNIRKGFNFHLKHLFLFSSLADF